MFNQNKHNITYQILFKSSSLVIFFTFFEFFFLFDSIGSWIFLCLVSDLRIPACTFLSYIAYCDESHTLLVRAHIWVERRKSKCLDRKTDFLWQKNHNRKDVTYIKETISICQVNSKKFQNWQPFWLVLGMVQPQIKKMFARQILPLLSLSLIF